MKGMIIVALSLMLAYPTTNGVKRPHEICLLHSLTLLLSVRTSEFKGIKGIKGSERVKLKVT